MASSLYRPRRRCHRECSRCEEERVFAVCYCPVMLERRGLVVSEGRMAMGRRRQKQKEREGG